jgi:hypothetical protein
MLKHVQACGTESYQRIVRLEEMVIFNAETLVQYQAWKYLTVHTLLDERIASSRQVCIVQAEEDEDKYQVLELDDFLDTYEKEPVENGEISLIRSKRSMRRLDTNRLIQWICMSFVSSHHLSTA